MAEKHGDTSMHSSL